MNPLLLFQYGGKLVTYAVIITLGFLFLVVGGIISMIPSGSPNVLAQYKHVAHSVDPSLDYLDPYILDYFRRQNDFQNITNADIKKTVELFVATTQIPNPNYTKTIVTWTRSPYPEFILHRVLLPDGQTIVVKIRNPLWFPPIRHVKIEIVPGQPKYLTNKTDKSLDDVMTELGYSQSDYSMALDIYSALSPTLGDFGGGNVKAAELQYVSVDPSALYDYVNLRNSSFTLDDIITIEKAAKDYDVNPVLLVAITGQEESFVPKSWPMAGTIIKNPFNVFHSWMQYHTSLSDTAEIASRTVATKLDTKPPKGEDAIHWINDPHNPAGIYAQDPNWPNGVEDIFNNIEQYLKQSSASSKS